MTNYIVRIVSSRTGSESFYQVSASGKAAARKAFNPVDGKSHGYWIGEAMTEAEFCIGQWNRGGSKYRDSIPKFKHTSWNKLPYEIRELMYDDMIRDVQKFRKSQWA
jgi:hypothetical protein